MNFTRHFSLLICMVATLAAASSWRPVFGATVWFGIYGALHSTAVALAWRGPKLSWRLLIFVGIAVAVSMLSATLALYASLRQPLSALGPALPLALSSGLGALAYLATFRLLDLRLSLSAYLWVPVTCMLATWLVLAAGAYRYGGGLWFAAAWWVAFSTALWLLDRRRRHGS